MTTKRIFRVMLSSSFADLEDKRRTIIRLMGRHELYGIAMENDAALSLLDKRTSSLQKVDAADAYIGIIGRRYGTRVPPENVSLTELEWRRAKERGIPRCILIMSPAQPGEQQTTWDVSTADQESLAAFRKRLEEDVVCALFADDLEFMEKAMQSLEQLRRTLERQHPGAPDSALAGSSSAASLFITRLQRLFTDSSATPAQEALYRDATLRRISDDWINGVLHQSLYKVARIELGLTARDDVVDAPLRTIVQIPDREPVSIAPGTPIARVFDDHGRSLLILGDPGTGKTTLLLELAKELIERAREDRSLAIPVVFNLSTWSLRRQALDKWLVAELVQRIGVPKSVATRWIAEDRIVLLLDGLDEVQPGERSTCLTAINEFQARHGLLQMAVTSRTADFESLGAKIRLRSAVVLQRLSAQEVAAYLSNGRELAVVQAALGRDPALAELLQTPLMLWIAMLAYRQSSIEVSEASSPEELRTVLLGRFVASMFKRRAMPTESEALTVRRLAWIAASLQRNKQTVLYLEDLDFTWFEGLGQRTLARVLVALTCTAASGLLMLLIVEEILGRITGYGVGLRYSLLPWLSIGLMFGAISATVRLRPKERLALRGAQIALRLRAALRSGGLVGLTFGLASWALMSAPGDLPLNVYAAVGYVSKPVLAGACGVIAMAGYIFVQLFVADAPAARVKANQGTIDSVRAAIFVAVLVAPFATALGWSLTGALGAFLLGPAISISAGLAAGGLFCIKHYTLRLVLQAFGAGPLRYPHFLEQAVGRLLLFRVGGGYIFIHRLLQDYLVRLKAAGDATDRQRSS